MTVLDEYLAELVHAQLEGRNPKDIPEGIQVSDIRAIARSNHMAYLLEGALLKAKNLPEEYKEAFRKDVMGSLLKTMAQVSELQELEKRFEQKGIISQPMKGARMKFIYPAPEMREMSDIDILIRKDSMPEAEKVLKEMGYTLLESVKHHDVYKKDPFMVIEAHRSMYDKTVDTNQYEYFQDFSRAVCRTGCTYTYDFTKDDFYIYMIAHMAKHFYAMGCGIRNLVDIYIYRNAYEKEMNRTYIHEELKKLKLDQFTEQVENLTDIWLGTEESTQFYDNLFEYMLDCGIYGKDENGIWHKFAEEQTKDEEISRSLLRKWYLFPPMHYMTEYYPWLEGKPFLLPVAWGIRGFRGVFMRKGTKKKKMIHEINQDKILVYKEIYQKMGLKFK